MIDTAACIDKKNNLNKGLVGDNSKMIYTKEINEPITSSKQERVCSEQLNRILAYLKEGTKTLVMMRGASGSGKTYLAKQVIDIISKKYTQIKYETHILSTDDFFMCNGVYMFDKCMLSQAHTWNKGRACNAMLQGLNPIIIDNTNTMLWEMETYAEYGVKFGYRIEIMEPKTPWARNISEMHKRSNHNVSKASIENMLKRFEEVTDGENLVKKFGFKYFGDKPPILQSDPPLQYYKNKCDETVGEKKSELEESEVLEIPSLNIVPSDTHCAKNNAKENDNFFYEDYEQLEEAWENFENWNYTSHNIDKRVSKSNEKKELDLYNSKPQRKRVRSHRTLLPTLNESNKNITDTNQPIIVDGRPISVCIEDSSLNELPDVVAENNKINPLSMENTEIERKSSMSEVSIKHEREMQTSLILPDDKCPNKTLKLGHGRPEVYNEKAHKDDLVDNQNLPSTSKLMKVSESSDEDCMRTSQGEVEQVMFNLGKEFVLELDKVFGREPVEYPENLNTTLSLPMNVLLQINALWTKSLSYHLEKK